MFLAYVRPLGLTLVDERLYLPESWTSDKDRCQAAGVPEERRSYRPKTGLALEMLEQALERGHLKAGWVVGDDAFGTSPSFREGLAALGVRYVLDILAGFTVWPEEPERTRPAYQGRGAPRKPRLVGGQWRTMTERSAELPEEAWREITVDEGSQGPRSYRFSAQRVRPTSRRRLGEIHWAICRRNLDGSEPRYYLSNAPEDAPWGPLAYLGVSRCHIGTEFETDKSDLGLDEYEIRTWPDWYHHVALCLLSGAFLLSLQQAWGERCPGSRGPRCTGWCGKRCRGNGSGRLSCCGGSRIRSIVTNQPGAPMPSAVPSAVATPPASLPNRRCNTRALRKEIRPRAGDHPMLITTNTCLTALLCLAASIAFTILDHDSIKPIALVSLCCLSFVLSMVSERQVVKWASWIRKRLERLAPGRDRPDSRAGE